ncbi:MAG: hypothetical protein COA73_01675 [Candidatus Hydrogenedentota bacterium]|nr:MAG: hypothetical protein COA73_15995 [Candidatus Hydrogenedentota bacterium]PCJ65816.1 MAG: hypothetical protein COA73_01675 [Candidatus Hydrogenedentota bacterium]
MDQQIENQTIGELYLDSAIHRYTTMKQLGDKTLVQLSVEDMLWSPNSECNSIALTIKHLRGNMLSRWTDTLTTDGEKSYRNRDGEFLFDTPPTKDEIVALWEEGWECLLTAVGSFTADELAKPIIIRSQELALLDGINRQMFHVSYHVGQMVQLAKERLGERWQTLSIARGQSEQYIANARD